MPSPLSFPSVSLAPLHSSALVSTIDRDVFDNSRDSSSKQQYQRSTPGLSH